MVVTETRTSGVSSEAFFVGGNVGGNVGEGLAEGWGEGVVEGAARVGEGEVVGDPAVGEGWGAAVVGAMVRVGARVGGLSGVAVKVAWGWKGVLVAVPRAIDLGVSRGSGSETGRDMGRESQAERVMAARTRMRGIQRPGLLWR
mgnify:CR=1 FL=1